MPAAPGAALLAALMAALMAGCVGDTGDTGIDAFVVTGTTPDPGADDATPATQPEFRVNSPAEPADCAEESLNFVALNDDGSVAFRVDYNVVLESGGYRIRFLHDEPLREGYRYAVLVNTGGATTCTDIDGRPLVAYGMEFTVP
jgi:hypothetical protein